MTPDLGQLGVEGTAVLSPLPEQGWEVTLGAWRYSSYYNWPRFGGVGKEVTLRNNKVFPWDNTSEVEWSWTELSLLTPGQQG